ncbi:uncharacterized protein HHUB_1745 [Halobacterium hubeiense]|uniref:Uncharacterized protein n=1 Tax=Halobacterium hubeiense TaxID=1407499 RepID=A0A0U5H1E7_9EURY|nr:uncharacterized protein HHUB_1745 [Halobacterium hubeiense]
MVGRYGSRVTLLGAVSLLVADRSGAKRRVEKSARSLRNLSQ